MKDAMISIVPDRGDREILSEFCKSQLRRMIWDRYDADFSPDRNVIWMNPDPWDDRCDLTRRVKQAAHDANKHKFDFAFIIENDDFYPSNYFEYLHEFVEYGYDFIGWQNTFYYNIKTRRYSRLEHETHSSLFCTGFRLSALDDFEWPPDDYPFLDIALWKHAKQSGKNWKLLRTDNPCVGIKGHGMGKMGGKGHRMELMRADPEMKWFREKLNDEEAFKFYQSIV